MNSNKERAIALPDNDIGRQRYELFKSTLGRINQARENSYYLEAIALIESLIADRLESYLTYIRNENFGFKTLEALIRGFGSNNEYQDKIDDKLKDIVLNAVKDWKDKRNSALHEMAKIDFNNQLTWKQKCQDLNKITEDGLIIFRQIDNRLRVLRKPKKQTME